MSSTIWVLTRAIACSAINRFSHEEDQIPVVGDRLKPELEDDGYEVEVFTDSTSAIQRVCETCFDIFITDLKMQGPDRVEFLAPILRIRWC